MPRLRTGTSIAAVKGRGFTVLAADTQATLGHLAFRDFDKIQKITADGKVAVASAGLVSDSQVLVKAARDFASREQFQAERPVTAFSTANFLQDALFFSRGEETFLGANFIVVDAKRIFSVYGDGALVESKRFAVDGSGMELAMSFLDSNWKKGMLEAEAIKVAQGAIAAAASRDVYSGKPVKFLVIKEEVLNGKQ